MLSGVILTYNEERHIKDVINSIAQVCDEIIVVDSQSTDNTVQIAKSLNAKVVEIKWQGWVEARNYARELISNDFLLFLDADERLSEQLAKSILKEKENGFDKNVYSFNRLNFIGKKAIKHGAWFPDIKIRLYNKNLVKWEGGHVHEKANSGNISPSLIDGELLHYSYDSIKDIKHKTREYAILASKSLRDKSKFKLATKMILSPVVRFLRDYLLKSGFRDGKEGFAIAKNSAMEVFLKNKFALANSN